MVVTMVSRSNDLVGRGTHKVDDDKRAATFEGGSKVVWRQRVHDLRCMGGVSIAGRTHPRKASCADYGIQQIN